MKKMIMAPIFGLAILLSPVQARASRSGQAITLGVGIAACISAVRTVRSFCTIKRIKEAVKQNNAMRATQDDTIYLRHWDTGNYPTAAHVNQRAQQCVNQIVEDVMTGKLYGINPANYAGNNGQLHWNVAANVLNTYLQQEIDLLSDYLTELYPFVSLKSRTDHGYANRYEHGLLYTAYDGVVSMIYDYPQELGRICKQQNANINDPSKWTLAQDQIIDEYMRARASMGWKFLVANPNYGVACDVYWNIFKKRARLIAIKQALVKDTRFLHQPQVVVNVRQQRR